MIRLTRWQRFLAWLVADPTPDEWGAFAVIVLVLFALAAIWMAGHGAVR